MRNVLFGLLLFWASGVSAERLTVFAAASLKSAFDVIGSHFTQQTGTEVDFVFAGSSTLARQIQQGAPADVFVSANTAWMEVLNQDGALVPNSIKDLVSNQLVLVSASPLAASVDMNDGAAVRAAIGSGYLSMAMVDAVPAGIYGKQALMSLGIWDQLTDNIVQADNVRSALTYVALGEAGFGIVYASDVQAEKNVFLVGSFPEASHAPIRYPMAAIKGGQAALARGFFEFLEGADTRAIFDEFGFSPIPNP